MRPLSMSCTDGGARPGVVMYMYLIPAQVVLYAVISATSYYRFYGSTPFKIARGKNM